MRLMNCLMVTLLVTIASCGGDSSAGNGSGNATTKSASAVSRIKPEYATGFSISYTENGVTLLDIQDPQKTDKQTFHYALVEEGSNAALPDGYTRLVIPLKRVICMTSLQLSNFIKLGITEKVVGITSTRHLQNSIVNAQLKSGATHKIGIEGNFDSEVVMAIDPDVIFVSPFKRGGYGAIANIDVPMIPHLGYKELTPLGQAEWMKVIGLLTGESEKANEIFSGIVARYNELKALASSATVRPVVFSGEMRGGNWYAVGGRSFLAEMFRDAGADYFLKDNTESGGVTLDYETVYSMASDADYWRIVNSFEGEFSYEALETLDKRYTDFKAWKDKGVIYCNMKEVPFYESMPVEPECVLADLMHVFHPNLLPDYTPKYYHLLK